MGLIIDCTAVHGPLGQIVLVDSFVERMAFFWRMPPKWWEWRYSPDGWMIGRWRWVLFNSPHGPIAQPPNPAKFDNLLDMDATATVDGGTEFCMALYRRKPPTADWFVYALLSASPGTWPGGTPAATPSEPNINIQWPQVLIGGPSGLVFNSWGFFGSKGDPNHAPNNAPEGSHSMLLNAEQFSGEPSKKIYNPHEDWRYEDKAGRGGKGNPPPPPAGHGR